MRIRENFSMGSFLVAIVYKNGTCCVQDDFEVFFQGNYDECVNYIKEWDAEYWNC